MNRTFGKLFFGIIVVFIMSHQFLCCSALAATIINHNHRVEDLTTAQLEAARNISIYFNHKSIGGNIVAGMTTLSSQYPISISSGSGTNTGINHATYGTNGDPLAKISGFSSHINSGHDGAFMKFCVGDFIPWTSVSSSTIWNYYRPMMENAQINFPGTKIVWWTSPLTTQSDGRGLANFAQFNQYVRDYVADKDVILFDIADIESHDPNGNAIKNGDNEAMWNSYSTDGAHLNDAGQRRLASAFWVLLATIATSNSSPNPSPPASAAVSPSPSPSLSPSCQEDVNEDMVVNLADIMQILHLWNTSCTGCRADVNTDGIVNIGDIARILQQWGKVCN